MSLGLGIGGTGAMFERHRWSLLGGSVLLLGLGWVLNERVSTVCAPDGTCPPPRSRGRTVNRVLLAVCAVGVALFAFLPEILGAMTSSTPGDDPAGQRPLARLSAGAPELRDAFNRDQGSVRLLVLLAPT